MQLHEIIEENTLEEISQKTRLSAENLEKIFARDFGAFRKVQAMGFISILEREYHADLSELRSECVAYFSGGAEGTQGNETAAAQGNNPKPPKKKNPAPDLSIPRKPPRYLKPIVIGLVVLGILYGAWRTLASSLPEEGNLTQNANGGFFTSIVQQARSWMGEEGTTDAATIPLETNETETAVPKTDDQATDMTPAANQDEPTQARSDQADTGDHRAEGNLNRADRSGEEQVQADGGAEMVTPPADTNTTDTSEPDKMTGDESLAPEVPSLVTDTASYTPDSQAQKETMQAQQEAQAAEKAAREEAKRQKALQEEARRQQEAQAAREKAAAEKAAAEKAAQEQAAREQAAKEKAAREEAARKKAAREKAAREKAAKEKAAKLKAAKEKAAAEAAAKKGKIVIRPRAKIWIGKVNLATMQRSTVTTAKPFALDNLKGRWIVATGHGRFSLKIGNRVFNFNDSKKHFLIIQNGTAHEIPHATFQKLNQSKVW